MVILTENPLTHYENKRDMGVVGRTVGRLYFLRNFNNWAKSMLIRQYCPKNASVLDLCCGKGGDIHKWKLAGCGHYVGMDISEHAINHAVERYNKYIPEKVFPAIFIKKADVSDPSLDLNYLIPKNVQFDIVSCQMSLHYLFSSEQAVRTFLQNVAFRLVPGGYFIGTVPDANVLVKKLRATRETVDKLGKKRMFTFGNSFYSAVFTQNRFPKAQPFGLQYYFYLEDSVGRKEEERMVYVPEYLVVLEKLQELAKDYGLELVERKNLHDFFHAQIRNTLSRKMFYKMVHTKEADTEKEIGEQWDAVYLYMVFAFKKKGTHSGVGCGSCGSTEHLKVVNAKGWDQPYRVSGELTKLVFPNC